MRRFALLLCMVAVAGADPPTLRDRWFYYPVNLLVDENVTKLDPIWRRAAKAGYNGVMLADSKFGRLAEMPARYFENVKKVKALAAELKLEIVPAVFPIGYSEAILSRDPNLAEALPVKEAAYEVKGGVARPVREVALKGGDFADLGAWDWKDECVTTDAGAARMKDPGGKNARIVQKVKVTPFREYHLWVRVKAEGFKGEPRIAVLAEGGVSLNHANLGVAATQDWTTHHVVFNSLEHAEVGVYLGAWGADGGTLWWDDAVLEEAGPVNLVRRPGAPLVVKKEGGAEMTEGVDFEKLVDPKMGTVPWPGGYEVWHEPPALKTALPDGTRLLVSYYHTITIHDGQVMICPSEPKTLEVLKDHAKRVHEAFGAKTYFMSHDEIRVLNWCGACTARNLDAGALLADNARACTKILRELNPGGRILVWSDMFDPHHNARAGYYLVRGDLSGAWEGLDRDVDIACWYFDKRAESMKFFADRGHRLLVAGYYDADPAQIREWLKGAPNSLDGAMYTTWQNKYDDLEAFAEQIAK